jgi:competence protein ComEC
VTAEVSIAARYRRLIPAAPGARGALTAAQDGRLVPAAVAAWLATYAALGWSGPTGCLLGAVALAVAVTSLAVRCRWTVPVAVVGAGAGAALLVTGMRVAARDASPLAALAAGRTNAALWLTVREDPRPLTVRGTGAGGPEVAVPARAERLVAGGQTWRLSAQVLVLAPADGWAGLLPSQRVLMRGRLGSPLGADLTAAVVSTRAPPAAVTPPSWPQRAAGRLRAGLRAAAGGLAPGPAGLIPGLTVGDTSTMDPVLVADFRTAGLSHLVAVSGTSIA